MDGWTEAVATRQCAKTLIPPHQAGAFDPLTRPTLGRSVVIGQLGQSLDGRIATVSGHSRYINGEPGLVHLHRLRALVDAVVIGVGTAIADDPRLTTRMVDGPSPARVVIDPQGRMPRASKLLADDGVRRIIVTGPNSKPDVPAGVEIIRLAVIGGEIAHARIIAALRRAGLPRLLIEGGAHTLSGFLEAECLDRLHIILAPVIIGAGQPGLSLSPIQHMDEAHRPPTKSYPLGDEILIDCDFATMRKLATKRGPDAIDAAE